MKMQRRKAKRRLDDDNRFAAIAESIMAQISDIDIIKDKEFVTLQNAVNKLFDGKSAPFETEVQGVKINMAVDRKKQLWAPAPPKLDISPHVITENLIPKYHGALLNHNDILDGENVDESLIVDDKLEVIEAHTKEELEHRKRIVDRTCHSSEDFSRFHQKGTSFEAARSENSRLDRLSSPVRFESVLDKIRKVLKGGMKKSTSASASLSGMRAPLPSINENNTLSSDSTKESIESEIERLTLVIRDLEKGSLMLGFYLCRRGACYMSIGDQDKAMADLDKAIQAEPKLVDAYWHRHLVHLKDGDTKKSLQDLATIIQINPSHVSALSARAEIFKNKDDLQSAVDNYGQAINADPSNPMLYYSRASLLEEKGNMLLALEDYKQASILEPEKVDAIRKVGLYHYQAGSWMAGIADFSELLLRKPDDAEAYIYRGKIHAKLSNFQEAIHDLSLAINLQPNNFSPFFERGCLLRRCQQRQALQDFSVSLLLNSSKENVSAFFHRGILYTELKRFEEASIDFKSAIQLEKTLAPAHVNLGLIEMLQNNNVHVSIKSFDVAIRVDPTFIRAYLCRAEAYLRTKNIKAAVKDYTRVIHLCPDNVDYKIARGRLLLKSNQHEMASFHIRQCAAMSTGKSTSPTQKAAIQTFLKNYKEAMDVLDTATKSNPVAYLFTLLGKVKLKGKYYKEAISSFEKALNIMKPFDAKTSWPFEASDVFYLVGLCFIEMQQFNSALDALNNALKINSEFPEAYYQRGLVKIKLNVGKCVHDFNRALVWNKDFYQAYLGRAAYYGMKGRYAKAIMNCNEAIKLQPNSVRAYLYRGSLKFHIKAFKFAVNDLTKVISIENNCLLGYFNRAVCYHEMGHYFKAIKDYSVVMLGSSQALSTKALLNRGLLYFEIGNVHNALYDFLQAVVDYPKNADIHHILGLCYHKIGQLEAAAQSFTHALLVSPFFADALLGRGNVLMDYNDSVGTKMGRRDYLRALHMNPLCLEARVNLAYNMQVQGRFMTAWNLFTRAIELDEGYTSALEGRAVVSLQMSNFYGAFLDINNAIKLGKTAEMLTNRGVINQFMGHISNAMRDYQEAIKLDPSYGLAYFNAGNVYLSQKQYGQAITYYDRAIGWNGSDESALCNRAICKAMIGDVTHAFEDFEASMGLDAQSAHLYFNRGNLYYQCKRYQEAEADYTKALSLKPRDAIVYKMRADTLGKLGEQKKALDDYRKALKIQMDITLSRKKKLAEH